MSTTSSPKRCEMLAGLVAAAPLPIVVLDRKDRVAVWNPAAERVFGWTAEEVLGRPPLPAAIDLDDTHLRIRERALRGETLQHVPARRRRKDGGIVEVAISAAPVRDSGGAIAGFMTVLSDLTPQRELEAQLRQAQKMEAIGRLAGGVAHDFNNALAVILSYVDLVLGELEGDEQLQADLGAIKTAAKRASTLTRQLLAFSRQQVLEPQLVDLNTVVTDLEKMIRRSIGEDVEVALRLGAGLPLVEVDPGQIEQVLLNLVVNARDAMPEGGKLCISTSDVDIDDAFARGRAGLRAGRHVLLAVSDSGVGMDAATKARIFEPFFTTKEQGKSTGLGLSTTYGIVKQSNGYIDFESELGRGTTFRIYLPAAQTKETTRPPVRPSQGTETVLVVEDETALRLVVQRVLEAAGYTVLMAGDGRAAVDLAERHRGPIHLVLSDVVLPKMGGRELVERLTALRPQAKVLFMSGYTDRGAVGEAVSMRGARFLQKPFSPADLRSSVRNALDWVEAKGNGK